MGMKSIIKNIVLLTSIPLVLASCAESCINNINNGVACLETSTTVDYEAGKCFQTTRKNVVETIYLIGIPNNPEADPSEYEYDFTWNYELQNSYFDFVGGLKGKKLISVLKITDYVLKLNINGMCEDLDATYGYIRAFRFAFTATSDKLYDKSMLAYIAIGETSSVMVDKPAINEDGTLA